MKLEQITSFLEEAAPLSIQESYDNSGLIMGDPNSDVSGVLVCLDVDEKAINYAIEHDCQMVLSHHPVIFSGIKTFTGSTSEGDIIIRAIKNDLALYGYHTNFDSAKGGLSELLCERLGIKKTKILIESGHCNCGAGRYGDIEPATGEMFIKSLKSRLSIDKVRCVGEVPETISRVAVYNGAYDSDILEKLESLRPIILITGDLKYHAAQELMHKGIFTIDAGHYGTEKLFVEGVSKLLEAHFPELKVVSYESKDVFTYF